MTPDPLTPSRFWHGRRVLVAGGAGFVGSYLVPLLVEAGSTVRVADNLERGRKENLASVWDRIDFLQLDLTSLPNCLVATADVDIVMNLAAKACGLEYSQSHHGEMLTVNTVLGFNLLEASRQNHVDRVLVVSSSCVYPDNAPTPTPESASIGIPETANEGYGYAKISLERQSIYYAREFGMKIAIARPNNVYGLGDSWEGPKAHVIPLLIKRVLDGNDPVLVWGSGQRTRAFVHARDVAFAMMLLTEHYAVADPVNISHPKDISIGDLVAMICRLAGRHPKIIFDTSRPEGARRKSLSCEKLRSVTGGFLPQTELEHGLREMVDWYRANAVVPLSLDDPVLSVVIPVFCEDEIILETVNQITRSVTVPHEIIVVYDFEEDTTLPYLRKILPEKPQLKLVRNTKGPGALNAIRCGIYAAKGDFIVFVNADLSDDMSTIPEMLERMQEGYDVVCGSRFSSGGKKLGGPFLQDLTSRLGNLSFSILTRFPTRDLTNSFKMYRASFVKTVDITSTGGFEFSFELLLKARDRGLRIGEVGTLWTERKSGVSHFRLLAWLPKYLRWYALGLLNIWFGRALK